MSSGSRSHECCRSSQTDLVGAGKEESANAPTGTGHNSRRGLRGVEHGRAAVRTEVEEGAFVSLVRDADVLPRGPLGRYLFFVESRLGTEDASSSPLAGETVADRDSNRLSLDGEPELLTTTRGVSSAHERDRSQGRLRDIPRTLAHARSLGARGESDPGVGMS